MSATTAAPDSEPEGLRSSGRDTLATSPLSDPDTLPEGPTVDDVQASGVSAAAVKDEDGSVEEVEVDIASKEDGATTAAATTTATPTTLRPDPPPSAKRIESEVGCDDYQPVTNLNIKKRKRATSPPWTFPTAGSTSLKSVDGRRTSARFNISGTPSASKHGGADHAQNGSVSSAQSKAASPPWKRFAAEGPTSVVVDGKRKSGRVNRDLGETPTRVSPRRKKWQNSDTPGPQMNRSSTRASKALRKDDKPMTSASHTRNTSQNYRPSSAHDRIAELRAQINALQPTRSFASPEDDKPTHKRKSSVGDPNEALELSSPETKMSRYDDSPAAQRPTPKIKLRFTAPRHLVPDPHPNARLPCPTKPPELSVFQRIERLELKELQLPYSENERGAPDMDWFVQRAERSAIEEGQLRRRILGEAQPGGILSKERSSLYQDVDPQPEPPKQYGHHDHLVAHALHLRHLQLREKTYHRNMARKIAHEALDFWKAMRGPTEEDIREQEDKTFRLIYRQIVADVHAKWDMVAAHVQQQRLQRWEAQEEIKRQQRLQEKLEWSENMVARQRGEADSDVEMADSSEADSGDSENEDGEPSEEENMSQSSSEDVSEADDGDEGGEMDAAELEAYMRQREAEPPDKDTNSEIEETADTGHGRHTLTQPLDLNQNSTSTDDGDVAQHDSEAADISETEVAHESEVAPNRAAGFNAGSVGRSVKDLDEESTTNFQNSQISSHTHTQGEAADTNSTSDESVDMDSEDFDSDEDMSSTDEEIPQNDDSDVGEEDVADSGDGRAKRASLLGFYSKNDIKTFGLPTPTTSAEGDERDRNVDSGLEDSGDGKPTVDVNNGDVLKQEPQDADQSNELEKGYHTEEESASQQLQMEASLSDRRTPHSVGDDDGLTRHMVPSPTLLRGTLRSYQHAGLDWLASLYRNGTNGILADEMGLGKTIQTIALLAYLAEEHECWETHLVIVPTSVILNWVMEFQKFLPGFRVLGYYGSTEERQLKRRGWVNDPHHENRDKRGYNVVVTSYNVAMQDINALRNVQWHYLVLDEAHNIRNFNSQRWQVLIRLKTRARLLLTGTPLQNSLTELWSLLTFLTAGDDDPAHGDLEEFLSHWKEPVKEIFDRGVQTLSNEAQRVVDQLHVSLRPFLLRRLKIEVEKDLPKKTESVVVCKLSKRQRQLYQDYMGLAEVRHSLTQGNAVSAGRVLLSLRRVCNHPDLFDPRPIQTSFGMGKSPLGPFAATEKLVRRLLGIKEDLPQDLVLVRGEHTRKYNTKRSNALSAISLLQARAKELEETAMANVRTDESTLAGAHELQRVRKREAELQRLRTSIAMSAKSRPAVYGTDLHELVTIRNGRPYRAIARLRPLTKCWRGWPAIGRHPLQFGHTDHRSDWLASKTSSLQQTTMSCQGYADRLHDAIVKFAFCTPAVTSPILDLTIPDKIQSLIRSSKWYPSESDYAQEARVRTSIAFPDSRLLIYDSGKLQRLSRLLRELQSKGSRSLIFTQMTGTLNILEQFLSLLNLPYLRLDGSTPVERRQLYTAEFNRPDSKYQCMILSSRAGGVGLNLTGASSVIFYDLDWNPQMDRQCMDRAHRIGQVRDVEVYKMVSEKTVEENVLRRANQKSLLDQTVIQEGHFTTEYQQQRRSNQDGDGNGDDGENEDDVAAAIERFLGGGNEKATTQAIESVEDKEDVQAAQQARREDHQDDADFADRSSKGPSVPPTPGQLPDEGDEQDDDRKGHVDVYMIRQAERLLADVPFVPPQKQKSRTDKHGRDRSHRPRRKH